MANDRQNGFTLVEVLVACALLALVIVPTMRAFSANRSVSENLVDRIQTSIESASANDFAAFEKLVTR